MKSKKLKNIKNEIKFLFLILFLTFENLQRNLYIIDYLVFICIINYYQFIKNYSFIKIYIFISIIIK